MQIIVSMSMVLYQLLNSFNYFNDIFISIASIELMEPILSIIKPILAFSMVYPFNLTLIQDTQFFYILQ